MKIYTDGACKKNPGKGGWAFIVIDDENKVCHQSYAGVIHTTNNRMELTAVLEAAKWLGNLQTPVEIYTDSKYVYNGITSWITKWKKNKWLTSERKPVLNDDLWRDLDFFYETYKQYVTWKWVKGHSGDPFNDLADSLASAATQ